MLPYLFPDVTIASNAECPTMKAQVEGALAWKNYAIVMPDYYGFGVSADRPQAYLDAETTAQGKDSPLSFRARRYRLLRQPHIHENFLG